MKADASKILKHLIIWLLLLIPISFKVELFSGVVVLFQDLFIPLLLLLYAGVKNDRIKMFKFHLPYLFLSGGLIIILISTLISFFRVFDIIGFLKLFKYLIYVISLIFISRNLNSGVLNKINNIAIITILLTLIIYLFNKINSSLSWGEFMQNATWMPEYMPTGFSNRVLSLENFKFFISSNNHGIYGSYLALIFFINLSNLIRSKVKPLKTKLIVFLCLLNILLLTSRETFLLILVTFGMYLLSNLLYNKIKILLFIKFFTFSFMVVLFVIFIIAKFDIELSIMNKVQNMIEGLKSSGGDGSMNMRFNTWSMIMYLLVTHPVLLLFGTGFNPTFFENSLDNISFLFPGKYVGVPENLFLMFLSYGGIFAFMFLCLFFYYLFYFLKKCKFQDEGMFLTYFLIGLIITNNTGGSMIAELFLTQFGLVYFCLINKWRIY